jgi:hypothetical protein
VRRVSWDGSTRREVYVGKSYGTMKETNYDVDYGSWYAGCEHQAEPHISASSLDTNWLGVTNRLSIVSYPFGHRLQDWLGVTNKEFAFATSPSNEEFTSSPLGTGRSLLVSDDGGHGRLTSHRSSLYCNHLIVSHAISEDSSTYMWKATKAVVLFI